MIRNVLSIAGSDPSGGAGIQADIKAISANGAYGMAAVTALTAQNTRGVLGVHVVPPEFVRDQIAAVLADVRVDAIKIGMIATAEIAAAIATALADHSDVPIVLDPVMIAKGGAPLLADDAVAAVREELLPLAAVLTPNLPEAGCLLQSNAANNRDEMASHARQLCEHGPRAVLLKGGHLPGDTSPDCLASAGQITWFEADRTNTSNTHGTGCTLSAALATQLARGHPLAAAVDRAKTFVARAIAGAGQLDVGSGHGPTHHFVDLW